MIYQRGMMYKAYNREELLGKLGRIGIEMSGNCVVTKWDGRVVNATPVSEKYEIFDIVKYIKEKIDAIERNFSISKYRLILHRGRQSLDLLSDTLEIDGVTFSKSFHILNSTDRSRKLNFTTGLFCEDGHYYVIRGGTALTKSHIKGVTSAVETASAALEGETFAQQAESIRSLAGHKILLSNVRKTILGDKPTSADHGRFDAFKSCIRSTPGLSPKQSKALYAKSERTSEITAQEDFFIDAMKVLQAYLKLFANNDSHTISKETEKIMKMTQWSIRNEILDSLGI